MSSYYGRQWLLAECECLLVRSWPKVYLLLQHPFRRFHPFLLVSENGAAGLVVLVSLYLMEGHYVVRVGRVAGGVFCVHFQGVGNVNSTAGLSASEVEPGYLPFRPLFLKTLIHGLCRVGQRCRYPRGFHVRCSE